MSIVSSVHEYSVQADGSTSNVVRLYDEDGKEYTSTFYAPQGFDVESKITAMIAQIEQQLADDEFNSVLES